MSESKSGMSRAAQNKRKKQLKGNNNTNTPKRQIGQTASSDFSDAEDIPLQPTKRKHVEKHLTNAHILPSASVSVNHSYKVRDMDFNNNTILNILDMKEVSEVTSKERASLILSKCIHPTSLYSFYTNNWEKLPLFCKRNVKGYFKKLISKKVLTQIFSTHLLYENEDIIFTNHNGSVTSRSNYSQEEVSDNEDEAVDGDSAPVEITNATLWSNFAKGLTVKCIALQKYSDELWRLVSALEHEFECRVSCQVSLSPPVNRPCNKKQFDCSDAFVLQLEGSSRWCLYEPAKGQELPRHSGTDRLNSDEVENDSCSSSKKPKVNDTVHTDVTLVPGDSLYIPKGWSYVQYNPSTEDHSLSLSLLTNQGNAVADLLDVLVPQALAEAAETSVLFRRSLPRDRRTFLGIAASEEEAQEGRRVEFQEQLRKLLHSVVDIAVDVVDPAVDQIAKKFIMERLPVPLSKEEESLTSAGAAKITIMPYTKLRMVRPGVAIVLVEDGKVVVYHCMDNARELFGNPMNPLEFELDDGPTIEGLLGAYPEGVTVTDLEHPGEELEDKVSIAEALFREGFLVIDDEASKPAGGESDEEQNDDDPF